MNYYQEATEQEANQSFTPSKEIKGMRIAGKLEINTYGAAVLQFTKPTKTDKPFTLNAWLNPVDFDKVQVYEGQTQEAANIKAVQKQLRLFKNIARQYQTEEVVNKEFADTSSFEKLVENLNNCLPDNVAEVEGRLVAGYKLNAKDSNWYLTIPASMEWDGTNKRFLPFFTTSVDAPTRNLPDAYKLERPEVSTEVPADAVAVVEY